MIINAVQWPDQDKGEGLESVHHQRQRAQAAYDLVDYYNSFSRADTSRLDALKKENERLRTRLATAETDYIRVTRLNETYREELIQHRRRVSGIMSPL